MNAVNTLLARPVTDRNALTYDNAASTYGKIVLSHYSDRSDFNSLYAKYLDMLPLQNDIDESCNVTMSLLKSLHEGNPLLFNDGLLPSLKNAIQRINKFRLEGDILEDEGVALMMLVCNKLNIQ